MSLLSGCAYFIVPFIPANASAHKRNTGRFDYSPYERSDRIVIPCNNLSPWPSWLRRYMMQRTESSTLHISTREPMSVIHTMTLSAQSRVKKAHYLTFIDEDPAKHIECGNSICTLQFPSKCVLEYVLVTRSTSGFAPRNYECDLRILVISKADEIPSY